MKKLLLIIINTLLLIMILLLVLYREQKVAVLTYHSFATSQQLNSLEQKDNLVMNIEHFEEQLAYLKKHHYKTLTLEEFYCFKKNTCQIPRKSVLITMDDGYQSNYELAFPLLKKYQMQAVVFYIGQNETGSFSNYMDKETLRKAQQEYPNITFASHSYYLHERGMIDKGEKFLTQDFEKMNDLLSSPYFAYPFGEHNDAIQKVLKQQHYKLAFTFGPKKEHRKARRQDQDYEIPRLNISNDMPLWKFIMRLSLPY